jgi:hypothetical protein
MPAYSIFRDLGRLKSETRIAEEALEHKDDGSVFG